MSSCGACIHILFLPFVGWFGSIEGGVIVETGICDGMEEKLLLFYKLFLNLHPIFTTVLCKTIMDRFEQKKKLELTSKLILLVDVLSTIWQR